MPRRSRGGPSASCIPMPGWTTAAVTAQVRVEWFWMMATRVICGPCGGPSCTWMPWSTPGRSGVSRSSAFPAVAAARKDVQPRSPPAAYSDRCCQPSERRAAVDRHDRDQQQHHPDRGEQQGRHPGASADRPEHRQDGHRQESQLESGEAEEPADAVAGVGAVRRTHGGLVSLGDGRDRGAAARGGTASGSSGRTTGAAAWTSRPQQQESVGSWSGGGRGRCARAERAPRGR